MKRILVLIVLSVALVGCGDTKDEKLSGALGGSGEEDSKQLDRQEGADDRSEDRRGEVARLPR
jgi:hypothetical protein